MSDEDVAKAIEELTDLLLGMECAIEVEKMVLAGMEPHGREWDALRPGIGRASPLLVRLIRERASSLSNIRQRKRSAEALRTAIAALAALPTPTAGEVMREAAALCDGWAAELDGHGRPKEADGARWCARHLRAASLQEAPR